MDNQQPSLEKRKVQRLSHRGVPGKYSNIIWETPSINNKVYVYFLQANNQIRYVGITNDPIRRLSHHVSRRNNDKSYKNNWLKKCIKNNIIVEMIIKESYDTHEEAVKREEFFINSLPNLTNLELTPTTPRIFKCYCYDLKSSTVLTFSSIADCKNHLKMRRAFRYNKIHLYRYIISKENNFEQLMKSNYTIKAKNMKTNEITYYMSSRHFSWVHCCILSLVNTTLSGSRKSCKGYLLCHRNNDFNEYFNKRIHKILCVDDGLVFNSAKEAGEYYGIDLSCIVKVCKGKRKKAKNRSFKYY